MEQNHLLTKQDLKNIKKGFGNRHESVIQNFELWLKEMDRCCYIPVHKAQGELSQNFTSLKVEDFVLVFMSKWQLHLLLNRESDFICIDSIKSENGYHLTTLCIVDETNNGIPCAFLISSHIDAHILSLFYSGIKYLTRTLKTKIFMSNVEPFYYEVWQKIMAPAKKQLFCPWNVHQDWKNNLNDINSKEKQMHVYGILQCLISEKDKRSFDTMIQNFVKSLFEDTATVNFGRYFQRNYFHNAASWAQCYGPDTGIEKTGHLEKMLKTIKYLYCEEECTKRFDIFFNVVLTLVKNKIFEMGREGQLDERLISRSRKRNIHSLHEVSLGLNLSSVLITEWGGYEVSDESRIYTVQKNNFPCHCTYSCMECSGCIHSYSCTCVEYAIKWKMCKHIHLVLRYKKEYPKLCKILEEKHSIDDINTEFRSITNTRSNNPNDAGLQTRIDEIKLLLDNAVKKLTSHNLCDAMTKIIAPIHPTLDTITMLDG